ncbi:DUF4185 domain-containing protein [Flavihumibacter solisilvae]|uniref:DUF4185 domain-containing protein n=1 Tax=Flavihumibacter solisilvae TaxID=1349421 RepID=A0A0C1LBL3_9BACT|nr:DUF4185 domain-containing protein [Flavihumibacter solisilvae]KIC92913.1 hypothetical protein OI18_20210 [Flavihumibacter solisilvae]
MNRLSFLGVPVLTAALLVSCTNKSSMARWQSKTLDSASLNRIKFTVEPAPEWTRVFTRNSGWFGGDGIFAVTRDGKESPRAATSSEALFWFSDTMIGEITKDSLKPGFRMVNNSVAELKGGWADSAGIAFKWARNIDGKPKSVFIPSTPATGKEDYYWLGDGFVNHDKDKDLYIFGYRIRNTDPNVPFGFKEVGNTLVVIPKGEKPPFYRQRQIDIPFFLGKDVDSTGSFGAGLLVNTEGAGAPHPDGYLYVYGVRGQKKNVMVARVLPADIETFENWTFWDGEEWTSDVNRIQSIADRASNEMSVTPLPDGRYLMVFQADGLGKYVGMRLGASPAGPFGPVINVYDVTNDLEKDKDIFPYNAKAHPVISRPGELLISFNVNSFDFPNDILKYPHLYRPRFIRLKYQLD